MNKFEIVLIDHESGMRFTRYADKGKYLVDTEDRSITEILDTKDEE